MKKITYHADWLPLDMEDPGFAQFVEAERIRENTDPLQWGLLGGLDHITISRDVVSYYDRGMNGKCIDICVNIKKGTYKTVKTE